jgi:hypothetical protein
LKEPVGKKPSGSSLLPEPDCPTLISLLKLLSSITGPAPAACKKVDVVPQLAMVPLFSDMAPEGVQLHVSLPGKGFKLSTIVIVMDDVDDIHSIEYV